MSVLVVYVVRQEVCLAASVLEEDDVCLRLTNQQTVLTLPVAWLLLVMRLGVGYTRQGKTAAWLSPVCQYGSL